MVHRPSNDTKTIFMDFSYLACGSFIVIIRIYWLLLSYPLSLGLGKNYSNIKSLASSLLILITSWIVKAFILQAEIWRLWARKL